MFVINRKGQKESMRYDNITDRNVELSRDLDIDVAYLSKLVIQGLKNGIKTSEIDELSSETAANMSTYNPEYDTLASRIVVSNLHKNTKVSFIETMRDLFNYKSDDGRPFGIISQPMMEFMEEHKDIIENTIDYKRDFNFSYFGFKTLVKSYLNKINNKVVERPQHMLMRVAIGIHGPIGEYKGDINKVIDTYNEISQGKFTHASPTLFNACAERSQLSSCFLLHMEDDLEHIYETNKRCALISKYAGGIGIDISKVRAKGSKIHSTNGRSDGIVPMVQVFNSTARYCNQCFVPETDIFLKHSIKKICDVKEGDFVITKDGSYKRVNEVFVSERREEILRITNTNSLEPIECTKQHELYVLKRGHYTPEFMSASEVEVGDFMVYISSMEDTSRIENVEQYYSYGKLVRNNLESNFKLDNLSLFDTKPKIIRFVTGLITNVNDKGNFQIEHPSFELKKQIRYLLIKINVLPKYNNNILEIPGKWLNFKNSPYTYSEITHIQKFNYEGKVYDLNIEQNHNYMTSNGLVHNSGRRKGSIAMYLQPWHPDIFDFLSLRYNNPPEELRARDIFLALWTPDIFMKRVEADDVWSLFCPSVVPKLADTYGEEFDKIYIEAEKQKLYFKQVKAREVWEAVLRAQEETGLPYMLFKDNVNNKSNQKNIGIIRSSNLCVSGDTKILTKKYGYREIKELEDTYEELWNGYEWSNSLVKKTSESSKLLKICFSDGSEIKCTKEHKFIVPSGDKVDAQELKIGHKIMRVPSLPNNGTDLSIYKDRKVSTQTKTEAQNLKMLYQTYGVNPHIKNIYDNYELVFSEQDSQKLLEFGIVVEPTRDFDFDIYVVSITEQEEEPTWCFGEPLRNQGMFNGILAGNCTEIVEYTDKNSVAVCNLASIALPKYVYYDKDNTPKFNFKDLGRITEMITENLNLIIDKNFYPVKEAETNNLNYRPIGIGVQGLADVFAMFKYPWESAEAKKLNRLIFEVIYYHAVKKSHELSLTHGSYNAFEGSPISQGILQYDMWNQTPLSVNENEDVYLDWNKLKQDVKKGMRNSLLVAPMPTASTAQILGNNEAFEPFTSNIYSRSVLAGDFIVVNKHLYKDLKELNLWDKELVDKIIKNNGSVQTIEEIPENIRKVYKTVWEIPQRVLIDMAADRGAFIDQSQSLNVFIDRPTHSKLTSMHFYSWKKGLKTGSYYIRSKPAVEAVKFTIKQNEKVDKKNVVCTDEICTVCSS